jgi:hypothetical protein
MSAKLPARKRVASRTPTKPPLIDPAFAEALTALVAAGAKRALDAYPPAPLSNSLTSTLGTGVTHPRGPVSSETTLGLAELLNRLEAVRDRLGAASGQLSVSVERMTGRTITPRLLGQDVNQKESGQLGRAHAIVFDCFQLLDMLDELAASTAALL